jgi:hypothetical protein
MPLEVIGIFDHSLTVIGARECHQRSVLVKGPTLVASKKMGMLWNSHSTILVIFARFALKMR